MAPECWRPPLPQSIFRNDLAAAVPNEEAIQIQVEEDLAALNATKQNGAKAAAFIDVSLLREIESEGFFTRVEKP